MPHVKGNKFKPAVAAPVAPQVGALDVAGPSPVDKQPVHTMAADGSAPAPRGSSDTPRPTTHGAQVPTAGKTAAPHATAPPGKRRRKGLKAAAPPAQQVVQSLPATVVPPAPKASASGAIVAAPNWAALKAVLATTKKKPRANRLPATDTTPGAGTNSGRGVTPSSRTNPVTAVLALDCEMVGVGPDGERSSLARVCIVNAEGGILLDVHVQQKERVTDYRTKFSGIRPKDLDQAWPREVVQAWVKDLVTGRVLVGHALHNDLEALEMSHPATGSRDTARYPPFMFQQAQGGRYKSRSLKQLSAEELGLSIQDGEHSPVDDARAALYLYLKHRKSWERWLKGGKKTGSGAQAHKMPTWEELSRNDGMIDL
ncbi:hypothetical protein ACKKBF_B04425 [Auxenochlorella protothecoides x Auxenochlorella symbiontica]